MFKRFFEIIRLKSLARQLRKPGGAFGNKVGMMMNKANQALYDFTIVQMKPGYYQSILEIGFGNGKFFEQLYSTAEGLDLAGIDYSPAMVHAARNQNQKLVLGGKLKLVAGNSNDLPFAGNSFDKVFCINVAYFWEEPVEHLKEILRVLKPGGMLYVTIRTIESMERMPFTKYGFKKYTVDTWKEIAGAAGHEWVTVEKLQEPASEFQPDQRPFESICLVTKKPVNSSTFQNTNPS